MTAAAGKARGGVREQQRLETERLIRRTALALFLAHGFDGTTTKQIAETAGVAHGTVFLVAATKEALLVNVLEERLREVVVERSSSLPRRGIEAQLAHLFDGLFDFYATHPALSRVFLRGVLFFSDPGGQAQYDEHVSRFAAHLAALFDGAAQRGELAPRVRSDPAAASVLGVYLVAVVGFLNEPAPDRAALGARFRASLALLMRGLRSERP